MSEDKQVMDMVNDHAAELMGEEYIASRMEKRTVREAGPYNDRKLRAFLLMAIKALLWVLLGLVVLSMALGGYAGIVAAACVCQCIAQAAVRVDRFFRRR